MGKRYVVWLDSGANQHAKYSREVDIDEEFDMSDEEFDALPYELKEAMFREIAFEQSDWGFAEVTDDK
ncbi:MAG: DUF7167 family protein [Plesiomonas shigelloides]